MVGRIGNLLLLFVIGVFGLIYFINVQTLPELEERLIVDLLFWSLMVLLVLEAGRTIYKIAQVKKETGHDKPKRGSLRTFLNKFSRNKQSVLIVSLIIYILLFPIFGFFATSFIFLVGLNYFLGSRKIWELVLVPSGVLIFLYIVFVYLLRVRLPEGFLF